MFGRTDSRSEKSIGVPNPKIQQAARGFFKKIKVAGIDARIISGTRTYAEQVALYDKAAEVGLSADLEWGGSWRSFKDKPHYQMATGLILVCEREKFDHGQV